MIRESPKEIPKDRSKEDLALVAVVGRGNKVKGENVHFFCAMDVVLIDTSIFA